MFDTKPFAARYVEFRPTDIAGLDACGRFELYGCAYGMLYNVVLTLILAPVFLIFENFKTEKLNKFYFNACSG